MLLNMEFQRILGFHWIIVFRKGRAYLLRLHERVWVLYWPDLPTFELVSLTRNHETQRQRPQSVEQLESYMNRNMKTFQSRNSPQFLNLLRERW